MLCPARECVTYTRVCDEYDSHESCFLDASHETKQDVPRKGATNPAHTLQHRCWGGREGGDLNTIVIVIVRNEIFRPFRCVRLEPKLLNVEKWTMYTVTGTVRVYFTR